MNNKISSIKERILLLAENQENNKQAFFKKIGMTYGNFTGKNKERPINSDGLANILFNYPVVNPEWLLTGHGPMLRSLEWEGSANARQAFEEPRAVYGKPQEAKSAASSACEEKERIIQMYQNQIEDLKINIERIISDKAEVIKMKDAMLAMKEEAIKGKEVMLAAKDEIISIQSRRISELEDNREAEDLKKILGTSEKIGQESTSLTDIHPKDLFTKAKKGEYKI